MSGIAAAIPPYVRRILVVGSRGAAEAEAIARRPGVQVEFALAGVGERAQDLKGSSGALFDCVVFLDAPRHADAVSSVLPLLSRFGEVLMPVPTEAVAPAIPALGMRVESLPSIGDDDPGFLRALRPSYDPREHARALKAEGRPDLAYLVLRRLAPSGIANADTAAAVAAETQLCLLEHDRHASAEGRLVHFYTSQTLFYQAVSRAPRFAAPYQCQAEFWRRIGDLEMARRLLQSIQAAAPTDAVAKQLAAYVGRLGSPQASIPDPPPWEPTRLLRVLLITHTRPDYGLDVLYDGLRTVLGPAGVLEYPWKPLLHGAAPAELANYPSSFSHAGKPIALPDVLAQLRDGRFDLLLFGDTERKLGRDDAHRILDAAGDTPWAIVDQGDDPCDLRAAVLEHVGRDVCLHYFKREMLACHDYGSGAYPLPFAYPDARIPAGVEQDRDRELFWAGHREFGLRRLYLDHIEERLGSSLDRQYPQAEYASALRESRIGLSLFGLGFDTVRYWELPAHGCLLLAERPPIRIPFDFEDGRSAVFFGDLPELAERLDHLLGHRDEASRVAAEGYRRVRTHHTASARARHLLCRVDLR